ncbi:MAG: hypothetical protein E5Y10_21950 [Mesorhizobium sp.]|uniref:hypothetical protein n=1 Tax=Mesorhizobium sp. TaxID=1871066 RepID=UPI00120767E5|nr:hypothetical protein [Mesorhizobium sp.]TIN36796.1 MAG: hypothetical protein E5Y13_22560 [Mesorhizobium sp.]TJU72265.1 MAG: hypothetical protein E5Y15_34085 [Mesorhizobium sp.]TJU86641.1 MAG: hypothetical protein E5Y10_21950 [Mesorhizobium sp.]
MDTAAETTTPLDDGFEWAIVEIFGHRKHAGRSREEERFGAKMLRIDVPTIGINQAEGKPAEVSGVESWTTHWYGGASLFSYTLTDEATVMRINRPYVPASRYIAPPDRYDGDAAEDVSILDDVDDEPRF